MVIMHGNHDNRDNHDNHDDPTTGICCFFSSDHSTRANPFCVTLSEECGGAKFKINRMSSSIQQDGKLAVFRIKANLLPYNRRRVVLWYRGE